MKKSIHTATTPVLAQSHPVASRTYWQYAAIPTRLLLILVLLSLTQQGWSQVVIGGWNTSALLGGTNDFGPSPFSATATASNVTVGGLTRGSGVGTTGSGASRGWGGNSWSQTTAAAGVTGNQFITFTVKANAGYTLSLSSINPFDYRRSGTGPTNAEIQYQINSGAYTLITTVSFPNSTSGGGSVGSTNLSGITALQNLPSSSTVTFRIVPYGATGATGTFYIFDVANSTANDFAVNGTVACEAITFTGTPTNTCANNNSGQIAVTGVTGGTSPYTYSKDNGANYQAGATFTGLAAGTYQVVVKGNNGCTSSATPVSVGIFPGVSCSINGPLAVCANSTGNVYSATGGMSAYNWGVSGSGSIAGASNGSSVTVTAGASGTYTVNVTVTDGNGCQSTCSQPVSINALPSCTITGPPPSPGPNNDTLCIGHEYVFNAPAGMSAYKWGVVGNGTINGSATGSSVSITVNGGALLQVRDTVTDANGCISTCVYNRPVQGSPTCTVNGPATVCAGTVNQYSVTTNGQFYTWSISGNGTIIGATNGSYVSVTAGASGTYTVTVDIQFSSNTCGSSCSQTVTVNPTPTPTITGLTSVCSGGSVTLDAGAGYSVYAWSGGGGSGQTATYNNITSPTTYTVTVTSNGCTGTDTHVVTVNALPSCNVSGADFVCSNNTGIVYSAPGGMSAYSWGISGDGTITSATNGSSVTVTSGNYANSYTVYVTITDGNGCVSSCSKRSDIFLFTPQPANITITPNPACFGVMLVLNSNVAASSTVSWSGEGIVNANNPSTTAMPTTTGPHTYSLVATTDYGCSYTGTASVMINPLPPVNCPPNSSVCSNAPAYALSGGSPGGGVYSGPGVSAGMFNPATAGPGTHTITYTVTDGSTGCTNSCTFSIQVNTCVVSFSGQIKFSNNIALGVKDALVTLTGPPNGSYTSDINGNFTISTAATIGNFILKPTKTINKLNGLSVGDVTAIQQHANNITLITDLYKQVAADVNKSNSITVQDASIINQALLGNAAALNQIATSWRFVPTNYTMTNPPWGFPEQRTYTGASGAQLNQDFYGIKTGDVATVYANPANFGAGEPLVLRAHDQLLKAGESLSVEVSADQLNDLAAFQFALAFDPAQLQFIAVEPLAGLPLTADQFGLYNVASGEIRALWSQPTGLAVAESAPLFRLRFTALQSGTKLSEVLHLNDDVLPGLSYTSHLAESGVQLKLEAVTGTNTPDKNGILLQNRPNPFSDVTTIEFVLPAACDATLRVFDVNGRLLREHSAFYAAGAHAVVFDFGADGANGVLQCELTTPFGVQARKMVLVRN